MISHYVTLLSHSLSLCPSTSGSSCMLTQVLCCLSPDSASFCPVWDLSLPAGWELNGHGSLLSSKRHAYLLVYHTTCSLVPLWTKPACSEACALAMIA